MESRVEQQDDPENTNIERVLFFEVSIGLAQNLLIH